LCVLILAVSASAATIQVETVFLSNENGLIDDLIALGHGSDNLYTVLQFLQPYSGGAISSSYMTTLAATGPGSEAFDPEAPLSVFASIYNNPIGVGADGYLIICGCYGYFSDTWPHYSTFSDGGYRFTSADDPAYRLEAHTIAMATYTIKG
jgi:hypothetical protein